MLSNAKMSYFLNSFEVSPKTSSREYMIEEGSLLCEVMKLIGQVEFFLRTIFTLTTDSAPSDQAVLKFFCVNSL